MNPEFANLPIRDMHLPEAVSWWPPAPGWWLLLLLLIFALAGGLRWLKQRRNKLRLYKSAMAEIQRLEQQFLQNHDSRQLVEALSVLMRRISLSCYPKKEVASLSGAAWLEFLNRAFADDRGQSPFSATQQAALLEGPFNPRMEVDGEDLLGKAKTWIERVTRREVRQ